MALQEFRGAWLRPTSVVINSCWRHSQLRPELAPAPPAAWIMLAALPAQAQDAALMAGTPDFTAVLPGINFGYSTTRPGAGSPC